MRTPRLAGLGLATLATAAVALAGCENGTTPAGSAPTPTGTASSAAAADPAAVSALSKATALLGTTSFKVTATSGQGFKLTAAVDPPSGNGTAEVTAGGANAEVGVKTLLAGQDLYLQVPGVTKAGTWTHVDVSRLPAGANVGLRPGQVDPVGTAALLGSSTDVHSTGNSYAGTLDLTKATGLTGLSQVTVGGNTAVSMVPFTAAVDEQGRLTQMTISPPQTDPIEVLYSDYGVPVSVTKPGPAEITEAPDSFYSTLNTGASAIPSATS